MQFDGQQYTTRSIPPSFPSIDVPEETDTTLLAAVIQGLPEPIRLLLTLAIKEELTVPEVASVLDLEVMDVINLYLEASEGVRRALRA